MTGFGAHALLMTSSTATIPVDPAATPVAGPAEGSFPTDSRPIFARAARLGLEAIVRVSPDHFDDPTPCPDYDVHALLGHLVASVRTLAAAGRGVAPEHFPTGADDVADDEWPAAWVAAVDEIDVVFTDEVLDQPLTFAWATLPGRIALLMFTSEITLHTSDLATALGHTPAWDPEVTEVALQAMRMGLPAEPRGGDVPFGPVVTVADDAPAIDRLLGWSGRQPSS
jgi:uncharacterized protein (TIGR03086 family)